MESALEGSLGRLSAHLGVTRPSATAGGLLCQRVAEALGWRTGSSRLELSNAQIADGELRIARGFLGPQPAAVFASDGSIGSHRLLRDAARFAYHSSVHWGIIANTEGAVVFNSHWIRDDDWFRLPEIPWSLVDENLDILAAVTPEAVADGRLDRLAASIREPDRFLTPVDDALVARLDHWRLEALRYGRNAEGLDADLHTLFAQLFVLRAVEDRRLDPTIPPLESAIDHHDHIDAARLRWLFERARASIQSQLFADDRLGLFPEFVLAGIIRDLYIPQQLPRDSQRYNFAWIDADVLGRAYEKYLANVYMAAPLAPQLRLFDQPIREIEPVSVKKSGGVFYTPDYLVGTLTEQAITRALMSSSDPEFLPYVGDFACGSGSFLVAAVGALIRHLRARDPERNWARDLIEGKHVIGIDIDERAVVLSRMNLWIRLTEEPDALPLPSIAEVVVQGDSLGDQVWLNLPKIYDVVIGNPPFVATGSVQSRDELSKRFRTAQGRFDYAHLFVELAVSRLAPGGTVGMVVPNRVFRNRDAGQVRELLANQTSIISIIDFGSSEVFKGTSGYIGAIVARKLLSPEEPKRSDVRVVLVSDVTDTRYLGGLLVEAIEAKGELRRDVLRAFSLAHPMGSGPWILLSPSARRERVRL